MLHWLRKAFTQNLLLKFTALVCAVVVWVYADSFLEVERDVAVPLVFVGAPQGGGFTIPAGMDDAGGPVLPRVRLTVRGPSRDVRSLDPAQICYRYPAGLEALYDVGFMIVDPKEFVVLGANSVEVVGVVPRTVRLLGVQRAAHP